MNFSSLVLLWAGVIVLSIIGLGVFVYVLAKNNVFFAIVEQGWCKIVLEWGKYARTLGPGLQWIGIPGIYTLYKRKMTFFKSMTDKDGKPVAEPHEDKDVGSFKTVDYAYAFPFKDEEDSKGLPLSGMLAVIAFMSDPRKAFFETSDWYSTMITLIMPCWVKTLVAVSYDDDLVGRDKEVEKKKAAISQVIWEAINASREGGKPSVVSELHDSYGITVKSVNLRNVDPPEGWRATTLAPYKAERELAAAEYQAKTSAMLFDDTNQALAVWRVANPNATPEQIKTKQEELRDRALAKTPGYQQIHIKGLENANTAVVGGGSGTGVLVGGGQGDRKGNRKDGKNPGGASGGNPQGGNPSKSQQQQADEYFQQFQKYPKWDPSERTPN